MKIADNSLRKLRSTNSQRSNQQYLKAMSKDSAHHQGIDELVESPPNEAALAMSESRSFAAPAEASNVESSARSASERRRDFAASQTEAASTECELDRSSMPALRRKRLSFQVAVGNELALRRPLAAKSAAATSYDRWTSYMRHANVLSAQLASNDSVLSERLEARAASDLISSIGIDFLRLEGALHNRPPLCPPGATATSGSGTTKLFLQADYSIVLIALAALFIVNC